MLIFASNYSTKTKHINLNINTLKRHIIFLEIGGNIEDRLEYLIKTKKKIENHIGKIQLSSSIYESPPWGFEAEHNFLNQCLKVETILNPSALLKEMLRIEEELGRVRNSNNYESRTVDIDLLFYEDQQIKNASLEVPHPRMHLRKFVLLPLCEIAADFSHPILNKSIKNLLETCTDQSICKQIE